MKTVLGLTGPTGAGKSTVSQVAESLGIMVIDCDKVARIAVEPGRSGLKAIIEVFGKTILNPDGTLNRKALAKAAFCDKEHTELLNKTLLPHIVKLIKEMMTEDKILLDAPTLFESGLDSICNKTVAVLADKDIRLKRITSRDKIDTDSALLRINAGKDDEFYLEKADYCVYNNGNLIETEEKVKNILMNVFERN